MAVDSADSESGAAGDVVQLQGCALVDEGTGDSDDPVPIAGRVLAKGRRHGDMLIG